MAWFLLVSLFAPGQAQTPPDTASLQQAQKVVQEVFGREITKARTPAEKSKLAREILRLGLEDTDKANQYVALQQAKQLAIEAQDGTLSLEIVREMTARFRPNEDLSPADRLAEADKLWQQAQGLSGRAKLARQLEAIEKYLIIENHIGNRFADFNSVDILPLLKQAVLISFEKQHPVFPPTVKLVPQGPVAIMPGIAGMGIALDGKGAVEVQAKPWQLQDGFTVSAWFNVPSLPLEREASILTTEDLLNGPDERGYVLRIWNRDKLQFQIGCGTKRWRGTMTDTVIQAARWNHAVGTYDAQARRIVLYCNAKQIATSETDIFVDSNRPIWIGKRSPSRLLPTDFSGQIDEIAIFSRPLEAQHVAALYDLGRRGISLTIAAANTR